MQKVGPDPSQGSRRELETADAPGAQERPPEDTIHRRISCGLDRRL